MLVNSSLSDKFNTLLQTISEDQEFKKVQYYMRCMKKPEHGGVFHTVHQCMFLMYTPVRMHYFLLKGKSVPYPIELYKETVRHLIDAQGIDIEELLTFCFCVAKNGKIIVDGEKYGGECFWLAFASGVLSLKESSCYPFKDAIAAAVEGQINFTDFFDYDHSRLLDIFILWCVERNSVALANLEDVQAVEHLEEGADKYGLSNISAAKFERQRFVLNEQFFLYNIFFDTSIGSVRGNIPKTLEVLRKYPDAAVSVYMRKDLTLSVPIEKKVTLESTDMQKWRGITLNMGELESQIKSGKEVIVHYDPKTMHKILVIIRPAKSDSHDPYYQIVVEELWAPSTISPYEDVVLTNFIHGCYYPSNHSFDHIDFSVNQYSTEVFLKKYADNVSENSVSIEQHANEHYKVWCIKGACISLQLWSELVNCTLDEPFRRLFAEIIGAEIIEED